jgi:hypothetical protein
MQDFVHLHVHTQYSILDGQASIPRLVDKAMADGMKGIAVTDHGDMFGIKEFFNYVNKKNGKTNGEIKDLKKKIAGLEKGRWNVKIRKLKSQYVRNNWKRPRRNFSSRSLDVKCMWHVAAYIIRMENPIKVVIT